MSRPRVFAVEFDPVGDQSTVEYLTGAEYEWLQLSEWIDDQIDEADPDLYDPLDHMERFLGGFAAQVGHYTVYELQLVSPGIDPAPALRETVANHGGVEG